MISGYKTTESQGLLWDRPLTGHGDVRNVVGDLAERLTVALVGGRRHKTDSTASYCPDVSTSACWFESKAVGRSRTAFVYAGRVEKDRAFALGHQLVYVVWHHGADTRLVATVSELERLVLATMRCVYVVPFTEVDRLCGLAKLDKLNSRYGGTDRDTYGSGYRINLTLLERWVHRRFGDAGYQRAAEGVPAETEAQGTGDDRQQVCVLRQQGGAVRARQGD